MMSAPIYSQALRSRMLAGRIFDAISGFAKSRSRKSNVELRKAFFDQAGWLDAMSFGARARQHYCGLPFEAIEGDLHRMWEAHGRSEWCTVRELIVQGWGK